MTPPCMRALQTKSIFYLRFGSMWLPHNCIIRKTGEKIPTHGATANIVCGYSNCNLVTSFFDDDNDLLCSFSYSSSCHLSRFVILIILWRRCPQCNRRRKMCNNYGVTCLPTKANKKCHHHQLSCNMFLLFYVSFLGRVCTGRD